MQAQEAPAELMFKLWPWLEANKNRLIGAAVVVVVAFALYSFMSWRHEQTEIDAGQALTQLLVSPPNGATPELTAGAYAQLADKYSGTQAAQRAQLQAAAAYFGVGRYPDAQAQFQKSLDASSAGPLAATAALGLGSSLEAQGKLDDAATAYRRVTTQFADAAAALPAKFALGRIAEQQGKFSEAMSAYQELARNNFAGSLAAEAALRALAIKSKIPAAPAAKPTVPAFAPITK
jgi:predicted negative regulator of RcsB-dependent stress response